MHMLKQHVRRRRKPVPLALHWHVIHAKSTRCGWQALDDGIGICSLCAGDGAGSESRAIVRPPRRVLAQMRMRGRENVQAVLVQLRAGPQARYWPARRCSACTACMGPRMHCHPTGKHARPAHTHTGMVLLRAPGRQKTTRCTQHALSP